MTSSQAQRSPLLPAVEPSSEQKTDIPMIDMTLETKAPEHPYKKVLALLEKNNTEVKAAGCENIALTIKKYQTQLLHEMQQPGVITTPAVHKHINNLDYDLDATRQLVKMLIKSIGIQAAKRHHLPRLEQFVADMKEALYQAKTLCAPGPRSEEEYLYDMIHRHNKELINATHKEREVITRHYQLLSEYAKLLLYFRKSYKRRLPSRVGIKFGLVDAVKDSIEDILNKVNAVGEKICASYKDMTGDYQVACQSILQAAEADLEIIRQLGAKQMLSAGKKKTDFDWTRFNELIEKLAQVIKRYAPDEELSEYKAPAEEGADEQSLLLTKEESPKPEPKKLRKVSSMDNLRYGVFKILDGSSDPAPGAQRQRKNSIF